MRLGEGGILAGSVRRMWPQRHLRYLAEVAQVREEIFERVELGIAEVAFVAETQPRMLRQVFQYEQHGCARRTLRRPPCLPAGDFAPHISEVWVGYEPDQRSGK